MPTYSSFGQQKDMCGKRSFQLHLQIQEFGHFVHKRIRSKSDTFVPPAMHYGTSYAPNITKWLTSLKCELPKYAASLCKRGGEGKKKKKN